MTLKEINQELKKATALAVRVRDAVMDLEAMETESAECDKILHDYLDVLLQVDHLTQRRDIEDFDCRIDRDLKLLFGGFPFAASWGTAIAAVRAELCSRGFDV